jgi:ATP-dependent DNA ligase
MVAKPAAELPRGPTWVYEPKFDGFRGCAWWNSKGKVRLQSRQGRNLTDAFPEICAAVAEQCRPGTVLDGEIVCWRDGRFDFSALLGRLGGARAPAASLVVFDMLADAGQDLRGLPYLTRRDRLLARLELARLPLAVVPQTSDPDVTVGWLADHPAAGIEGVVAKRVDQHYNTIRNSWRKIRTRLTDEAVVGGVIGPLTDPSALILGRLDAHDRLRLVGRTTRLSTAARLELRGRLRHAHQHPWPESLRSRFSESGPLRYIRVRPDLVVELDVDTARDHGVWRHPVTFKRLRPDLTAQDLNAVQ